MAYQYNVFLSYRRRTPVGDWVHNHFYPQLRAWLGTTLGQEDPGIFVDQQGIPTGATWPAVLRNALKASRCLVSVWSPDYFRSDWCVAEHASMRAREQRMGLRTDLDPSGIIYPVVFFGETFPAETSNIQRRDLRPWNIPAKSFEQTVGYVAFIQEIQHVCNEIADMITRAPAWQDDWPIEMPDPTVPAPATLLRF
jgi:TIR domain